MNYNIRKLALLLLIAMAGYGARAQQSIMLPPGKSYTFTGTAATGSGTITYQWYRNGVAISGATSASYTLPAGNAIGKNVEFKRAAMSSNCPGEATFSNMYYVSFCGIIYGNTCWASCNATSGNTFASRPDEYTPFFQWNRTTAWAATGTVNGWSSSSITDVTWTVNPCPTGWRLPLEGEWGILLYSSSSTWAAANTKGNAVAGKFFTFSGSAANCSLPNNMANCMFIPASGYRNSNSAPVNQGTYGYYWSSQGYNNNGYYGYVYSSPDDSPYEISKVSALAIRCVYAD